jgi:uncharacterized membrane protein YdjX (TVP38/TMEM64 family)
MLQIVTAFLPAPPIQMLAGLTYGMWWGSLICLAGILLGNTLVFTLVRHGGSIIKQYFPRADRQPKERFLSPDRINSMRYPGLIVFALYLIPGMPNGLVPYVFARTDMKLMTYLLYVAAGSVPAIVFGTGLGTALSGGNTTIVAVLAVIMVILFAVALVFRKRILARIEAISR